MQRTRRPLMALAWGIAAISCVMTATAHDDKHHPSVAASSSEAQTEPFGQPGSPKNVSQTVAISLTDAMRFTPSALNFKRGDTVRLHITNSGKAAHEFVLGTKEEIAEHAAMMRQMPDMVHADASSVRLAPGRTADIVWQFSNAGKFFFACLIPGHWEAGMQGSVTVTEPARK